MVDDLAAATGALRRAEQAVIDAERALADAKSEVPLMRRRLHAAVVRAAQRSVRQRDIMSITGYNRESVRRILRAGGVGPPTEE